MEKTCQATASKGEKETLVDIGTAKIKGKLLQCSRAIVQYLVVI
jgi:hypothetical protein